MTFTETEYIGLIALIWCLVAMVTWLQLRRATAAERGSRLVLFLVSLGWSALFVGLFALNFIFPASVGPTSWQVVLVSLAVLVMLGLAMNELRIAFRARNTGHQRSPAHSDTIGR